jgi:hypothetical protein
MSNAVIWLRMTAATVGLVGLGYGLMRVVTPTPEQTYQAMAPDLRRKVDANRAARLAQEQAVGRQLAAQKDDADADKPLWADNQKTTRVH